MTTITAPTTANRVPVDWTRNNARAAGILYLITFAASIPAAFYFLTPVLTDPNYIISSGDDTRVITGCLLDVVNALAAIGTAVAVYPVVKRQNQSLAIGFVTTRTYEAAVIMIGVVSLLAVVTLRQDAATKEAGRDARGRTRKAGVSRARDGCPGPGVGCAWMQAPRRGRWGCGCVLTRHWRVRTRTPGQGWPGRAIRSRTAAPWTAPTLSSKRASRLPPLPPEAAPGKRSG